MKRLSTILLASGCQSSGEIKLPHCNCRGGQQHETCSLHCKCYCTCLCYSEHCQHHQHHRQHQNQAKLPVLACLLYHIRHLFARCTQPHVSCVSVFLEPREQAGLCLFVICVVVVLGCKSGCGDVGRTNSRRRAAAAQRQVEHQQWWWRL